MDSGTVTAFCDIAHQLLPALGAYASIEAAQRNPEDDALIRQLRVAAGAINMALMEVPRFQPPPMPQMMPPSPMSAGTTPPARAA